MARFKVKSKERKALARELRREISSLGLVDTGAMKDGVRVTVQSAAISFNQINLTVVAPYWYLFQDKGTSRGIDPQNITKRWLARPKVKTIITEILQQYIDYTIENFPILQVAKVLTDPVLLVGFSFYGDASGKWNVDISPTSF